MFIYKNSGVLHFGNSVGSRLFNLFLGIKKTDKWPGLFPIELKLWRSIKIWSDQEIANRKFGSTETMEYDVALSFAGEDRKYVEDFAHELTKLDLRVVLDELEAADSGHLLEKSSRFAVIFVSDYFVRLLNPQFELLLSRLAQDQRLFIARFDDAVIESFSGKTFFDAKEMAPGNLAWKIIPILKSFLFENTNPETFVTKIKINKSGNISDLTIDLSDEKRKHLILTGKNGSGKTSLLNNLRYFFEVVIQNGYGTFISQIENLVKYTSERNMLAFSETGATPLSDEIAGQLKNIDTLINRYQSGLRHFGGNEIYFTNPKEIRNKVRSENLILKYFRADRRPDFQAPQGIEKVKNSQPDKIDEPANSYFIQYLVNLKAEKSFAHDDGETEVVERLNIWFDWFESKLRDIFNSPDLQLIYNRKTFNFELVEDGRLPSGLNKLPDGHAAVLDFVSELIIKMAPHHTVANDLEGVVMIDEIEKHLDVELQQRIFPFLTNLFPKIQFIITTHSPFVLSSISNAVVCDLEKRRIIDGEIL